MFHIICGRGLLLNSPPHEGTPCRLGLGRVRNLCVLHYEPPGRCAVSGRPPLLPHSVQTGQRLLKLGIPSNRTDYSRIRYWSRNNIYLCLVQTCFKYFSRSDNNCYCYSSPSRYCYSSPSLLTTQNSEHVLFDGGNRGLTDSITETTLNDWLYLYTISAYPTSGTLGIIV